MCSLLIRVGVLWTLSPNKECVRLSVLVLLASPSQHLGQNSGKERSLAPHPALSD
jgi:hypothetical protein